MSQEVEHDPARNEPQKEPSDGWTKPPPLVVSPTYWPAVAALSIVILLFGFLTSWAISAVGFITFVVAMSRWIGEMDHDV
jgi:hypothetical protein